MNISFQKIALVIGLATFSSLVSCQKDSSITPDQPHSSARLATDDVIVVNMAKKYTLTKQGNAILTYYPDGRLQKVTQGADFHRDYTYSGNSIQAISYRNGKMAFKDTYLIDPATNRCYESVQIDYKVLQTPFNSNLSDPFRTRTWVYAYNAKGQLTSCGEKYKAGNRTEYSYNAQGNLNLVTTYWEPMSKVNPWYTITLKYLESKGRQSQNPGQINVVEYVEDKYPTNFNWILLPTPYSYIDYYAQAIPERYLKIYGKVSKNLLASANWHVEGMGYHGSNFTYSLNADGYVTERKRFDDQYPQLLETEAYDYNVSYLGVSL